MNKEDRISRFSEIMGPMYSDALVGTLNNKGFFTAPASAGHHGAYEGGLFDHSFNVTRALLDLTNRLKLQWYHERSPLFVGMFHDLCKIDSYILVKDETGKHFEYDKNAMKGHGDKSVQYLQVFCTPTAEEEACIRWHMGAFDEKENWKFYTMAVKQFPNVLYTHTADMIASQLWEK